MRNADPRQMFTVRFTTVDRNDRVAVRDQVIRTVMGRHVDIVDVASDDTETAVVVPAADRAHARASLAAFEFRFAEIDDRPETVRFTVTADQFAA
jgi:hypothetical protein